MKIKKILLSVFLLLTLFNIQMNETSAMGNVKIDGGSEFEYEIEADVEGSIEPGLPEGFVQSNSKKLNFEKDTLEALSAEVGIVIMSTVELNNGQKLIVLQENNNTTYQSVGGGYSSPIKFFVRDYLIKVNADGTIAESMEIATGEYGDGTAAFNTSTDEGVWQTYHARNGRLFELDNGYAVSYWGHGPASTTDGADQVTRIVKLDADANFATATWSTPTINEPAKFRAQVFKYDYEASSGAYELGDEAIITILNREHTTTTTPYVILDTATQNVSVEKEFEIETWDQMTNSQPFDGTDHLRNLGNIFSTSNGTQFGTANAVYQGAGGTKLWNSLYIWDTNGNVINIHSASVNESINIQPSISNDNEVVFMEGNRYLKKINLNTYEVSIIKEFPTGTNITIKPYIDTAYGTTYSFEGYAGDNTGAFEGYGNGPGAVIGGLDENFDVVAAAIVITNPAISMSTIGDGTGNLFTYGNLNGNKTFANEPTSTTNGIDGNGWFDKAAGDISYRDTNDVYFGSMKKIDDYAPAIKVGDAFKLNIDELTTQEEIDAAIAASVEVYDTFELSPKNPNNDGLTAKEIKARFDARLNRNPEELENPIDWAALGLDTSKVGYNLVKFFITDTNNQMTANSKVVNVVKNTTVDNGVFAIDANNFHVSLDDASSLDLPKSVTNSSATAWNKTTGENYDSSITVDAAELAVINATKVPGIFDLTFSATDGTDTITNTVKVFVGGGYDPVNNIVLFANGFELMLEDAELYSSDEAVVASEAVAYDVATYTELDSGKISADVANINSATEVGPQDVTVSYVDGDTVITMVVASVIDDYTVTEGDLALKARSYSININDLEGLTRDISKTNSEVKAWDTSDKEDLTASVTLNDAQYDAIKNATVVGSYPLTYTVAKNNKTLDNNVLVHVLDEGDIADKDADVVIFSNDFRVALSEAATYDNAVVDSEAYAVTFETGAMLDTANITADVANVNAATVVGPYEVTLTYDDGISTATTTVIANVYDDSVAFGDKDAISAKNVVFDVLDVEAFSAEELRSAIETRSAVTAWNTITGADVTYTFDESVVLAEVGEYELTFTTEFGTVKTITVYVLEDPSCDSTGCDAVDVNEVVVAESFRVGLSEVADLDETKVITLGNAKGIDLVSGDTLPLSADYSAVLEAVGPYDVTYTTENGTTKTVKANVYDDSVAFGDTDAISAYNIVFDVNEVAAFSAEELRSAIETRSAVMAWNTKTGEEVTYTFDESVVLAEIGEYELTFTTEFGTVKTITVYVLEDPSCDSTGCDAGNVSEVVTASDFTLKPEEVAGLTEDKVIELGNAKAIEIANGSAITLSADYSAVLAEAGSYDVVYTTENGTTKTVKATVGPNLIVDKDSGIAISADDTFFTMKEVKAFTSKEEFDLELLVRSNAKAWVVDTNEEVTPIAVDSSAIDLTNIDKMSYDALYSYQAPTRTGVVIETTARVTIADSVGTADAIVANDFALASSEVSELNATTVVEFAGARAWLIADNSEVEIVDVDYSAIKAEQGVYDVTFTNAFGTSITVQAFVGTNNRPIIDTDNNLVVFANDYSATVDEVGKMSVADHIKKAGAVALDKDTYEELEITEVNLSNVQAKAGKYAVEFSTQRNEEVVTATSTLTVTDDLPETGLSMAGVLVALILLGLFVSVRFGYKKVRN